MFFFKFWYVATSSFNAYCIDDSILISRSVQLRDLSDYPFKSTRVYLLTISYEYAV